MKTKDKHLGRLAMIQKKVEREMRLSAGIKVGRPGIHVDKRERRVRHMGTKEWLEEAEDDALITEEVEAAAYEAMLNSGTVACVLCGKEVPFDTAHPYQDGWVGDACCWDRDTMEKS